MVKQPVAEIATILRHDARVTSYKLALLRAINDVVLAFPDIEARGTAVAIPLRILARPWIAYYWPFVDPARPILQGPRAVRRGVRHNDISGRPQLTELRGAWQAHLGGASGPSDGFFVVAELALPRRRALYPRSVLDAEQGAIEAISDALRQPIQYAGPGRWTLFARPARCDGLHPSAVPIPGARPEDACLVIRAELWRTFRELSLWVEALAIHEWSLFTERVARDGDTIDRGEAYRLLTDRPVSRRSLAWERARIDELLADGDPLACPWTGRRLGRTADYDLDHLVPVALYPINELWNLVPADPHFNTRVKRDRLPSEARLAGAEPRLAETYARYLAAPPLARALADDVALRFPFLDPADSRFPHNLARAVVRFIGQLATARNVARFD